MASAVAFSPLGDYLGITLQGNNEVVVFDTLALSSSAGLGGLVTRLGAGNAPQGLCFDPTTTRTMVANFMSRNVSALETASLFEAGDIQVSSSVVDTVAVEPLSPQVFLGKQLFYDASPPRMSALSVAR